MHKIIHWFRHDLRLSDNPSLLAAAKQGMVLPLYIFDDVNSREKPLGAASRCWLHHSLQDLQTRLNGKLIIKRGNPQTILLTLIKQHKVTMVHWNRCYEPWQIARDKHIKATLRQQGVVVATYNGSLLWEPWEIKNKEGGHYKVFTPFYRKGCLQSTPPRHPTPAPKKMVICPDTVSTVSLVKLDLLANSEWEEKMMTHWKVGELAAKKCLKKFIAQALDHYKYERDFPAHDGTSYLSPHLHWGEISPNQVWYAVNKLPQNENTDCFLSELGWREFSYSLLYYYPFLSHKNLQAKFNQFPWRCNQRLLRAWQYGKTGYPIVDAGMRQLWQTGYMHNRVRMIVGSFLVKNLLLHWHAGEQWFWDCLVDADLASNSAGWQWVSGCGADAAPFFRIFNPVTQAKKFDATGEYIKQYVPELTQLPQQYLFAPWLAPQEILTAAGIILGKTYPCPIVDLASSRQRALAKFKKL